MKCYRNSFVSIEVMLLYVNSILQTKDPQKGDLFVCADTMKFLLSGV